MRRMRFCLQGIGFVVLSVISLPLWANGLNEFFGQVNGYLASALFFNVGFGMPFIVAWLIVGAVFLTVRMGFINLRMFFHAYCILRGRYTKPGD